MRCNGANLQMSKLPAQCVDDVIAVRRDKALQACVVSTIGGPAQKCCRSSPGHLMRRGDAGIRRDAGRYGHAPAI